MFLFFVAIVTKLFGRVISALNFGFLMHFVFTFLPLNPIGHVAGLNIFLPLCLGILIESCLIGSVRSLVNLNVAEW